MKKIGIIIVVIGVIIAVFNGANFITQEKVVDIGDISITADKAHELDWSPYLGAVFIAIGGGIYLYGNRKP